MTPTPSTRGELLLLALLSFLAGAGGVALVIISAMNEWSLFLPVGFVLAALGAVGSWGSQMALFRSRRLKAAARS